MIYSDVSNLIVVVKHIRILQRYTLLMKKVAVLNLGLQEPLL